MAAEIVAVPIDGHDRIPSPPLAATSLAVVYRVLVPPMTSFACLPDLPQSLALELKS
jgi:hypothetical protein